MRRRRRRRRFALPPLHPALRVPAALLIPAAPFIAAAATGTSQAQPQTIERPGVHYCAVFRWDVKTLTDPKADQVSPTVVDTTVHDLVNLPFAVHVPLHLPRAGGPTFAPVELTTYRIAAKLEGWKISADDGDIHLVVHDPTTDESMIVEFPDPKCTGKANGVQRTEMTDARHAVEQSCPGSTLRTSFHTLSGEATITGVVFFDKKHNQTGVALNGIELHPALGFESTDCTPRK
jgi:hypothetical protein